MKKIPNVKVFIDTKNKDLPVKMYTLPPLQVPQELDLETRMY